MLSSWLLHRCPQTQRLCSQKIALGLPIVTSGGSPDTRLLALWVFFFCVVLGSILAILVVLVLCLTFALAGRSCCTVVGGFCCAPEDYEPVEQHDHGLGCAPRDYQPVQQHDRDIEARGSPRSRGDGRPWSVLLLACCCGAFLAVPALAGGAFYWWRISGSPALVGLPFLTNSTRVHRRHGAGVDAGKERRKDKSVSSGQKVN